MHNPHLSPNSGRVSPHPSHLPECLRKWCRWGSRRLPALFARRVTLAAGQAQGQPGCSSTPSTPPATTEETIKATTPSRHDKDTTLTDSTPQNNESHHPPQITLPLPRRAARMALDSFFHNKIESMKLEIIQGQAVLRRLEAQRNEYNSRGEITAPEAAITTC